jgi:hypothetical protein
MVRLLKLDDKTAKLIVGLATLLPLDVEHAKTGAAFQHWANGVLDAEEDDVQRMHACVRDELIPYVRHTSG